MSSQGVTMEDGFTSQLPLAGVRILALEQMQALPLRHP
jgi:hypothetical protein